MITTTELEEVQRLVEIVPRRVSAVIKAKGAIPSTEMAVSALLIPTQIIVPMSHQIELHVHISMVIFL